MRVKLYRAQVGHAEGIDVSRKSAGELGLPFAPPWDLVMASKRGEIEWQEYTRRYLAQLDSLDLAAVDTLYMQGYTLGGELCVLCYCRDGANCHTLLLIEWLCERFPAHFEVKLS